MVGTYLHGTRIGALVAMKQRRRGGRQGHRHARRGHQSGVRVRRRKCRRTRSRRSATIFVEQAKTDPKTAGKPQEIVAKIIEGKVRKWLGEITLLGQPFVKDDKQTVEQYLKKAGGEVAAIVRYEVGAGIEKKQEDFADEVRKQVRELQSAAGRRQGQAQALTAIRTPPRRGSL